MTTWHAPADTLVRFARSPEALDETTASSVEQHLVSCGECRARVAGAVEPAQLDRSWAEVVDVLDHPSTGLAERLLVRVGLTPEVARVVGATPGLRVAWLATMVVLAVAATLVARDTGTDAAFLVLAPLVPLGSVFLSFFATDDPAGEAGIATPMHGAGLVLRRALATLVPTFLILALASVAQADLSGGGALWVLPGLALTLGALALATVTRITVATASLAAVWLGLGVATSIWSDHAVPVAEGPLFAPVGQAVALALALVAAVSIYVRRDHFSTMETSA